NHGARAHARQVFTTHQLGRLGTGNEHATNNQVARRDLFENVLAVGVHQLHVGWHDIGEIAQSFERHVEHNNLGAHTSSNLCSVDSNDTAAKNNNLGRCHTRNAAEQHTAAA